MATEKARGLSSRILDVIRDEVKTSGRRGPAASDYYAKQANPKDGGYAKSNYVKGDGTRVSRLDLVSKDLTIRVRPGAEVKKRTVTRSAVAKRAATRRRGGS